MSSDVTGKANLLMVSTSMPHLGHTTEDLTMTSQKAYTSTPQVWRGFAKIKRKFVEKFRCLLHKKVRNGQDAVAFNRSFSAKECIKITLKKVAKTRHKSWHKQLRD